MDTRELYSKDQKRLSLTNDREDNNTRTDRKRLDIVRPTFHRGDIKGNDILSVLWSAERRFGVETVRHRCAPQVLQPSFGKQSVSKMLITGRVILVEERFVSGLIITFPFRLSRKLCFLRANVFIPIIIIILADTNAF